MKKTSIFLALILIFTCCMFACEEESGNSNSASKSADKGSSTVESNISDTGSVSDVDSSNSDSSNDDSEVSDDIGLVTDETKSDEYNQAVTLINSNKVADAYAILYTASKSDADCKSLLGNIKVVYTTEMYESEFKVMGETVSSDYYTNENVYDDKGNIIKNDYSDSYGFQSTTEYVYDDNNYLIKSICGTVTEYKYVFDDNGNVIEKTVIDSESSSYTVKYTYDDLGNVLTEVYEDGTTFKYAYDEAGRKIREEGPYANTDYIYDENGILIQHESEHIDDDSKSSIYYSYEYDEYGNITKKITTDASEYAYFIQTYEYSGFQYFYCPHE